jgi:hypothetical protein
MAISGDYPHPITVNGFSCRNCSDVALANRHIDPADPQSGPFGVNGSSPGKEATKNHFSSEARDADRLKAMHEDQKQRAAGAFGAAAYGAAGTAAVPGGLVDLSA